MASGSIPSILASPVTWLTQLGIKDPLNTDGRVALQQLPAKASEHHTAHVCPAGFFLCWGKTREMFLLRLSSHLIWGKEQFWWFSAANRTWVWLLILRNIRIAMHSYVWIFFFFKEGVSKITSNSHRAIAFQPSRHCHAHFWQWWARPSLSLETRKEHWERSLGLTGAWGIEGLYLQAQDGAQSTFPYRECFISVFNFLLSQGRQILKVHREGCY